jgi:hypothetical protein
MTTKTEAQWDERFGGAKENSEESNLFETFGEDLEAVMNADPATVWTVIEGDETENQYLLPGFHHVNRIGYVIAEKPITQEELDSGEWNEVLWLDYAAVFGDGNDEDEDVAPGM